MGRWRRRLNVRLVSHHDTQLPKAHMFVCIHSGGGGVGGFGALGDDSDEGDDEPQSYFAGGERR